MQHNVAIVSHHDRSKPQLVTDLSCCTAFHLHEMRQQLVTPTSRSIQSQQPHVHCKDA